jgi:predicted metalloprotease
MLPLFWNNESRKWLHRTKTTTTEIEEVYSTLVDTEDVWEKYFRKQYVKIKFVQPGRNSMWCATSVSGPFIVP